MPHFRGAAFIYERYVREKIIKKYGIGGAAHNKKSSSPNGKSKSKSKFVDFITPKKASSPLLMSLFFYKKNYSLVLQDDPNFLLLSF